MNIKFITKKAGIIFSKKKSRVAFVWNKLLKQKKYVKYRMKSKITSYIRKNISKIIQENKYQHKGWLLVIFLYVFHVYYVWSIFFNFADLSRTGAAMPLYFGRHFFL